MNRKGYLLLSTGECFEGELFGVECVTYGELVFTTAMTGYTETLTDPSYFGQIITFAYPLIGNYGVSNHTLEEKGFESLKIQPSALILQKLSKNPSHWNSIMSLEDWLVRHSKVGISGIDTRMLVSKIVSNQNLFAVISPTKFEYFNFFHSNFSNPIQNVSTHEIKYFSKGKVKIGIIDCGVKMNIIREFQKYGCEVILIPSNTEFQNFNLDGWVISNGPGNPNQMNDLLKKISMLFKMLKPILGICLGFQLMSLAFGAKVEKLPFGHRGFNHPVKIFGTQKGYLTSQNHGYVVTGNELFTKHWKPWFINANDETLEGIKHESEPFFGVQFHPESSGGPNDTKWVIKHFMNEVKTRSHASKSNF